MSGVFTSFGKLLFEKVGQWRGKRILIAGLKILLYRGLI